MLKLTGHNARWVKEHHRSLLLMQDWFIWLFVTVKNYYISMAESYCVRVVSFY